ncbi:DNA polymerase III subunit epsilon [Candidatus Pantoea edessiphila]|uniref:DNA polymerase III subunit epsilon n=1 Tax=Candidatus Pantoea edessiphila TaxID=2044610 RepID=A0A2P5SXD0_9GAMM|nr:DNA polymerase III subunit epsilon [Candidatus Pantoea edessiphila]MBK4775820.1 DNA polymerase III subunit epsilon [Pantoea sp. Edef]PPI86998.1 DNA polymerase III subunit epsilon [Candidatus Pantoea edessiphila]
MKNIYNRQIFLDTETTGINKTGIYYEGHRIIEIGAVEFINRLPTGNNFHKYLNPNRTVSYESFKIHGISNSFLINKPTFREIAQEFINYIRGTELIIHNASFDIDFINYELNNLQLDIKKIQKICHVTDSLAIARKIFPGKRNSLDALCSRYNIDHDERKLHSAILDATILSKVFLIMTSGQISLSFVKDKDHKKSYIKIFNRVKNKIPLKIIIANKEEILSHEKNLDLIKSKKGLCLWRDNPHPFIKNDK